MYVKLRVSGHVSEFQSSQSGHSIESNLQAPQRAWVTANRIPSRLRTRSTRSPEPAAAEVHAVDAVDLAIPRLLAIIEPRIVWSHPTSHCSRTTSGLRQPLHCAGSFFDGKQKARECVRIHGVYEGSYWRLLADVTELRTTLARLAAAPPELPLPILTLPQQPADILWDEYAPALQPVEENAAVPPLVLPAFQQPQLLVWFCQHSPALDALPFLGRQ